MWKKFVDGRHDQHRSSKNLSFTLVVVVAAVFLVVLVAVVVVVQ